MKQRDLPKLETEGFVTRQNDPPSLKKKAPALVRRPKKTNNADDELDIGYRRLLVKTGVCAAVAIAILIISSVTTPVSTGVRDAVDYIVNHEFDIDKDIGRLKFVEALDETESVFSPLPDTVAVYPADGEVITAFGDGGSSGVRMSGMTDAVLSIAKGTVETVGNIGGQGYVKVVLDSGETVTYFNIEPQVQVSDIVLPGQKIGTLGDDHLYMEMKRDGVFTDPIAYIKERVSQALR